MAAEKYLQPDVSGWMWRVDFSPTMKISWRIRLFPCRKEAALAVRRSTSRKSISNPVRLSQKYFPPILVRLCQFYPERKGTVPGRDARGSAEARPNAAWPISTRIDIKDELPP